MIRAVVTGSECTGKTTLAEALAAHYGTTPVPEFARRFVAQKGAAPEYGDVDAIARGQVALEDEHTATAPAAPRSSSSTTRGVLIQDTDLLSTVVYSKHYYGDCPDWIELALGQRAGDLYLLAGIDVPWTPDGDQRDRGDRREEMQELFRNALVERGLRFIEICGSLEDRLANAISAIDNQTTSAE